MTGKYEIRWKKSAAEEILRIEKKDRKRILEAVGELTEDPLHGGVKLIDNDVYVSVNTGPEKPTEPALAVLIRSPRRAGWLFSGPPAPARRPKPRRYSLSTLLSS